MIFTITVYNPKTIGKKMPQYFTDARNKYEAVGKMVLSDWKYKHLNIVDISS